MKNGRRRWGRRTLRRAAKSAIDGFKWLVRHGWRTRSKSHLQLSSRVRRRTNPLKKRKITDYFGAKARSSKRVAARITSNIGPEEGQFGDKFKLKYGNVLEPSKSLETLVNKINGQTFTYQTIDELDTSALNSLGLANKQVMYLHTVENPDRLSNAFVLGASPSGYGFNFASQKIELVRHSCELKLSNRTNVSVKVRIYRLKFKVNISAADIIPALSLQQYMTEYGWAQLAGGANITPNTPWTWMSGCIHNYLFSHSFEKEMNIDPGEQASFHVNIGTKALNPIRDLKKGILAQAYDDYQYLIIANGLIISNQATAAAAFHDVYAPVDIQGIITHTYQFRVPSFNVNQSTIVNNLITPDPSTYQVINDEQDQKEAFLSNL
jgi:hypothetical protein